MRKKMLLQLQRQLEILVRRRNNLQTKMEQIDDLPNDQITKNTYREWHEIYCKVTYLSLRIETIKSKMELLAESDDVVKSVISGSKGLFNYLIGGRNEN